MSPKSQYKNQPGEERRQWPRRPCTLEAELSADGYSSGARVRVTDISLGGCYVEMLSPPPCASTVKLAMKIDNYPIEVFGKVRSAHYGFGMGVGFTNMGAADFQALQKFVPTDSKDTSLLFEKFTGLNAGDVVAASDRSDHSRQDQPTATKLESDEGQESVHEVLEALIRIFCRKGLLTREEIVAEIEAAKSRLQT